MRYFALLLSVLSFGCNRVSDQDMRAAEAVFKSLKAIHTQCKVGSMDYKEYCDALGLAAGKVDDFRVTNGADKMKVFTPAIEAAFSELQTAKLKWRQDIEDPSVETINWERLHIIWNSVGEHLDYALEDLKKYR